MGASLSYPQVDLNDKVAVITGGNTGIGYETTKALAMMGAHTIIACRSAERGQEAIKRLKEESQTVGKEVNVELMVLDLASLESTKNFIENFKQKNLPLHMLICNAGIGMAPYGKTHDNLEKHFQVNHLGHFFICLELLPCMMSTEGDKRIVIVSSSAAKIGGVWDPSNLQGDNGYSRFKFYGNSKLYNIMAMFALQRRVKDCGITISSLHPGMVNTEIPRNYEDMRVMSLVVRAYMSLGLGRTPEKGAATAINCAVNPALNSQEAVYYSSNSRPEQACETARNEQFQEELWSISCDLLKDWMSPDVQSKYSTSNETQKSDDGGGVTDERTATMADNESSGGLVVKDKPADESADDNND